ncbi:MAG: T9SS type A sorting domain-containing protein, partial [candidate division Zixibacteria bacterium]|nr:T9SS type A sorting domain-containing protein [candidate division Zixibacteria bacterium]
FNATTEIKYILAQDTHVKLEIFNLAGQVVETLIDDIKSTGEHTVNWDASDMPSGIYLYKLTTKDYSVTKRMTLLK